jgi:dTDP-glucose 4,6-dehydratase
MRTILVTGAAGFIGSNFVRMLIARGEDAKLVALDKLTYAGNLANLSDVLNDKRLSFIKGDICDAVLRRRISRRSQHHVVRPVRADQRHRHAGAARYRQIEGHRAVPSDWHR